jgi:hypothetical protein
MERCQRTRAIPGHSRRREQSDFPVDVVDDDDAIEHAAKRGDESIVVSDPHRVEQVTNLAPARVPVRSVRQPSCESPSSTCSNEW